MDKPPASSTPDVTRSPSSRASDKPGSISGVEALVNCLATIVAFIPAAVTAFVLTIGPLGIYVSVTGNHNATFYFYGIVPVCSLLAVAYFVRRRRFAIAAGIVASMLWLLLTPILFSLGD